MMISERQVLKPGTSLSLDGRKCMILGVMGAGTSCIAYKAQMKLTIKDQTALRTIVLKELYPSHQNIIRGTDDCLVIPESSKALFEEESESFVKAAILQFEFHNEEDLTNFTSDIEVVYKLNNTLYSVTGIVSGKSYDKINPENITSILKVGESLSHAISYYHERDYLNLDIKPSNIFYENLPGDNVAIKLFDFNTVCTKEEASQGKFSYSDGYAAPEVKAAKKGSGKLSEVGEQADIYSIGAVIFEKIMGRIPKVADQRAGKRWKLENNPYLKDSVSQLQKGITELFRNTLAIDKNDRYSSAKELISELEKLIKLAGIEVFLKNQRISPCTPKDIYIPRKDVLAEISKRLDEKHILYLHALGGSGKSETAREYAEQYTDKYDFIQSVFYSGSLKKTIANLDFVGLKDKDRFAHTDEDIDRLYNYKYGLLGNTAVYGTNTLLIIDNYDYNADPTSEEYQQNYNIIRELKKLNIHILFTTRIKPNDDTECFDLENMFEEELKTLFFRINPKDQDRLERIELVKEIIEASYKHTMTVKLVAMQSAKYLKPLSEYLDILKTSGLNSGIKGRVTNEKDDESVTMSTVYDHIKALFNFNDLNDKQKYIMVNACLLPLSGLEANTFSEYIDLAHFEDSSDSDCLDESIEALVNSGWIEYADTNERRFTAETKITIHPLISDIVRNELKPALTEDKCRKFYVSFLDLFSEWGNKKIHHSSDDYVQENIIYPLMDNLDGLYDNNALKFVFNCIFLNLCENHCIHHHALSIDDTFSKYFGIDDTYTVPAGIRTIEHSAFANHPILRQIIIPDGVEEIRNMAFYGCTTLERVHISDSVDGLGNGTFSDCTNLRQVILPKGILYIASLLFENCISLQHIILPESVLLICSNAFFNCTSLTSIKIPKSVKDIGMYAFQNCTALTDITIPSTVTAIEPYTFFNCTALKHIELPDSINEIESGAFENCTALEYVTIPKSVKKIGESAFKNCRSVTRISLPIGIQIIQQSTFSGCSSLKSIMIPDSVTQIQDFAFMDCRSLETLHIPDSVRQAGSWAFKNCTSLKEITMPEHLSYYLKLTNDYPIDTKDYSYYADKIKILHEDSQTILVEMLDKNIRFIDASLLLELGITSIGDDAFKDCRLLTAIELPNSIVSIGSGAFQNCTSLQQIYIPESVSQIALLSSTFENCTSLKKIHLPQSIQWIFADNFKNCHSLTEISLPDGINNMAWSVFENCTALKKIAIPKSVTEITVELFKGCTSLSDITIPKGTKRIADNAFENCTSLKKITLPDSVEELGYNTFKKCTSLNNITLPENMKDIGYGAFEDCTSLEKITLSKNISEIPIATFKNCTSLREIVIPNHILKIGMAAFEDCKFLRSVELPDNIEIDRYAFKNCTSLERIILPESLTKVQEGLFENACSLQQMILPPHVYLIRERAFANCSSLRKIILSDHVNYIGECAFSGCSSLTQITLPAIVSDIGMDAFDDCLSLSEIFIFHKNIHLSNSGIGYYKENGLYKKIKNMTINGYSHSSAEQYAKEHGFKFVSLD